MTMKNINPSKTNAWQKLSSHYNEVKDLHLKTLFNNDSNRQEKFTLKFNDFEFDYSKIESQMKL